MNDKPGTMSGSGGPRPLSAVLRRTARLVWLGTLAELRSPGLRLLGIAGAVGAALFAWSAGSLAASAALTLGAWLGRAYGIVASLSIGYAAVRDLSDNTGAALRSKPVDGAYWVLVQCAARLLVWLILLALAFAGAALAQLPHAGGASLTAHFLGFCRAASVLILTATLSFALSRMLRSPLGGVLTVFAWFCTMAGLEFIPAYLRPDYSQNQPLFIAAAAFLLALAALFVERHRRGELRRPIAAVIVLFALLTLTAGGAARAYHLAPRYRNPPTPWERMSQQHLQLDLRVPGFWLPDGRGELLRTAPYRGRILLVYLFAAGDMEAARTLAALAAIQQELGPRGVQVLGVCFSPDHGDGWLLARAGGYGFPIGSDLATVKATTPPEAPIAAAYAAMVLPRLVVTDRRLKVREVLEAPSYDVADLRRLANERLAAEPE